MGEAAAQVDSGHTVPARDVLMAVVMAASAALVAGYLVLFLDMVAQRRLGIPDGLATGSLDLRALACWLATSASLFALGLALARAHGPLPFLIRHRIAIAAAILVACVTLRISGSSVAIWSNATGGEPFQGTLLGIPRAVRSDEWLVLTPFANAQGITGFSAISPIIRGGDTDVTMVYGQPAWAISTLFRPSMWGYLVLGFERGLAFFWVSRLLALLLVTFELARVITDGDDRLALFAAVLVAFAPQVQWWFAVNGTAELFVFGQGLVLSLRALLHAETATGRWGASALLAWLLGCYALILYPAWQVPFVYVFAAMGAWVCADWWEGTRRDRALGTLRKTATPLATCVIAAVVVCGMAFASSWDTIRSVLGTAYPGGRVETGGGMASLLRNGTLALPSALRADLYLPNVCECAAFFALFPLGIVLACIWLWRRRDRLLGLLLAVAALFYLFGIVGLPRPLARLTLLSNVTVPRLTLALGYLDVILLVRSLAVGDAGKERTSADAGNGSLVPAALAALAYAVGSTVVARLSNAQVMERRSLALTFAATLLLCFLALAPHARLERRGRGTYLLVACAIVAVAGLAVNPVQQGAAALTSSGLVRAVAGVRASDPDARWVSDDLVTGQMMLAAGVRAVNSTNVYPNLAEWRTLDPDGGYENVYNRYAHIDVMPAGETTFTLVGPDHFEVHVTPDDLARINVNYWLSTRDLSAWDTPTVAFVPVATDAGHTIYRIERAMDGP